MSLFFNLVILLAAAAAMVWWSFPSKLPPGPPQLPIVGNLHQLTSRDPWKQIQAWHKKYGPIITVKAGQAVLIILGDNKTTNELLNNRSPIYSSRPRLVVAQDYLVRGFGSIVLPYGPTWKQNHKIQMSLVNARRCELYHPLLEVESCHLLWRLLSGHDFYDDVHRYSSSITYSLLYGKRFITGDEHELAEIHDLTSSLLQALDFGSWLVDSFPILNRLPRPLCKWKAVGDDYHKRQMVLYGQNAKTALESPAWNWTKQLIQYDQLPASDEEINFLLGELFQASDHSMTGSLIVAVLACISYPQAMHRVQQEIDKIIGNTRLPTLEDMPDLPYVQAFVLETHRWRTVAPMGVPHAPLQDDSYDGFQIKQGMTIIPSHWSMNMDEAVFEKPQDFVPERWLSNPDLPQATFGYGRRTCPGRHFAEKCLLLAVSQMLWAFNVGCKAGKEELISSVKMIQEGAFAQPSRFEASFAVRTPQHEKVLRQRWNDQPSNIDEILNAIGSRF